MAWWWLSCWLVKVRSRMYRFKYMELTDDCTSVTHFGLFPILVSRSGNRYMLHSLTDLLYSGFVALAAGLSVGIGGLSAGYAIGIVGDYVSKSTMSI